jgi:hypothetical protein
MYSVIFFTDTPVALSSLSEAVFFILFIVLYLYLLDGLFFRTDWIIDKLNLNKGITEEKLELNIHRSIVLRIAVIVTGAIILVDSLPSLLKELAVYFQRINIYKGLKAFPGTVWIVYYVVKAFIGYFMVTSSRLTVNFIERKRKGKVKIEDTQA